MTRSDRISTLTLMMPPALLPSARTTAEIVAVSAAWLVVSICYVLGAKS